ncbi:hypothetical protein J6590_013084 [Homalodisca vitripennis]|nr:hypothetical protein J6590_013084 [Homalodisca vitripennis]
METYDLLAIDLLIIIQERQGTSQGKILTLRHISKRTSLNSFSGYRPISDRLIYRSAKPHGWTRIIIQLGLSVKK